MKPAPDSLQGGIGAGIFHQQQQGSGYQDWDIRCQTHERRRCDILIGSLGNDTFMVGRAAIFSMVARRQ